MPLTVMLPPFRKRIARYCEAESPVSGEAEVDGSRFGVRRVKGVKGCGARGKTIVFGLFGRNGRVYVEIVRIAQKPRSRG